MVRRSGPFPSAMALLVLAACTDEPDEPSQLLVPLPPGPEVERPDPFARSRSRFGIVELHAGFNPDPRVIEGRAVGEVPASSVRRRCKGWIGEQPDYLLSAHTAFLQLYLIARAKPAPAVVLRTPDGSVSCRRGAQGKTATVLRSELPLGTSQLWVGVAKEGDSTPYRLGFSEVSWRSSSVAMPKTTGD